MTDDNKFGAIVDAWGGHCDGCRIRGNGQPREDLLQIARDWQIAGTPFTGLAFAPQRESSVGTLIDDLGLMSECMSADEIANNVVFMPLK